MSHAADATLSPTLKGYVTHPPGTGRFPGIVVLMEAFGITLHIKGVCERLANAGFSAVAPDIFHGDVFAYTDMEKIGPKIQGLRDDQIMNEITESLHWLTTRSNVDPNRLGVIGFCMGGRLAFLANCRLAHQLKVAVSYYGGGIAPAGADRFGRTPPIGELGTMQAPMLLGYGADDQGIEPAEHARIAAALSAAKKRYTLAVYPGAGHGFLCEERASYAPQVADTAWKEILAFLAANLGSD